MNLPAGLEQFEPDFAAGLAAAHDEDAPIRELLRVPIRRGVHLNAFPGQVSRRGVRDGLLERSGRHDNSAGAEQIVRERHLEDAIVYTQIPHLGTTDGRTDLGRVLGERRDHFCEPRERVRLAARIHTREARAPIGRVQAEGVPACAPPRLRNTAAFENDMGHAESIQVIARREPCLPRTDDDAVEHDLDYRGSGAALDVTLAWASVLSPDRRYLVWPMVVLELAP